MASSFTRRRERFSRTKHHIGFPYEAAKSCLQSAGIALAEVDHVAHDWRPWMLGHRIGYTIPILLKSPRSSQARAKRGAQQVGGHYRKMFQLKNTLKPIVCTPEEAVNTFLRSSVDALIMENVWVPHPGSPDK